MDMVAATKHEVFTVTATEGYTTAEGRNYCVIQAQKEGCSHILFIDDDMTFPADTIERLLAHGKEIVGVASNSRVLPKSPTVGLMDAQGNYKHPQKYPEWEMKIPEELFKAFFVGAGVLLIDMTVFDKIGKPYFKFEANEDGKITMGEDGWFCAQARKNGYDIYCDPTIPIGHLGLYSY